MGIYDTLVEGETHIQVKCLGCNMKHYKVSDKVPEIHFYEGYRRWDDKDQMNTYAIILPNYTPHLYALIEDRIFKGFSDYWDETNDKFVTKWGEPYDGE